MATRDVLIPVEFTFEKGIDESQEATVLPVGFLASCSNWIPERTGGIRTRQGWIAATNAADASETVPYPSTDRRIRGMFHAVDMPGGGPERRWWIVGLENPDNFSRCEVWVLKEDLSGGWLRVLGTLLNASEFTSQPPAFGKAAAAKLTIAHPDLANLYQWDMNPANDATTIASMTVPGRALAWHKERMWTGGGGGSGGNAHLRTWLYYSNVNDGATWNVSSQRIEIGPDDGEAIEDLLSFSGQLLIAKRSGVWIMSGSTPSNFSFTRLDGCRGSRGRCLVVTPKGIVILGETEAWLWAGGIPQLISTPVQDTYASGWTREAGFTNKSWRSGMYAGGKVYITGISNPGGIATPAPFLVFDLVSGAWSTEAVGSGTADKVISLASDKADRLAGGPYLSTAPPLVYRDLPRGSRGKDFSTLTEAFSVKTADFPLTAGRQPVLVRHVWFQVRQRAGDGSSTNKLSITPYVDSVAGTAQDIDPLGGANPKVFWKRLDLGKTGRTFGFQASHTIPSGGGAIYDIEKVIAEIEVEPAR